MEAGLDLPFGKRIQMLRRSRGMDQKTLAMKVGRSASWMTKVERGERQVDSVTMLLRIAESLGVELHQITGRPYFPEPGGENTGQGVGLRQLRKAITGQIIFAGADSQSQLHRPLGQLREDARRLRQQYNVSPDNFSAVVPVLPSLITETRAATRVLEGEARLDALAIMANLYRLANLELRQYGELDLAWIAADKALMAAQDAGNPILVAACAATMTVQTMIQGHPTEAVDLAVQAIDSLHEDVKREDGPALVVAGALHLYAAQAAARAEDPLESRKFLAQATAMAAKLRIDREDYSLFFGPTNVGIQETGILVDLDDPTNALKRSRSVDPNRLPSVNRRCYFYLHRARAQVLKRQDQAAVESLTAAEATAPELTGWDPMTRESIRAMLERERRASNPQLRGLAERLGFDY